MSSKRIEETRSRSTERSPTGAPTAPTAPRIPSVVVQIPCAAARVQSWTPNSQGDRKKTEKMEKEEKEKVKLEKKDKKEKKEKKKSAATVTLVISSALGHLWVPRMLYLSAMGHLWVPRTLCCVQTIWLNWRVLSLIQLCLRRDRFCLFPPLLWGWLACLYNSSSSSSSSRVNCIRSSVSPCMSHFIAFRTNYTVNTVSWITILCGRNLNLISGIQYAPPHGLTTFYNYLCRT